MSIISLLMLITNKLIKLGNIQVNSPWSDLYPPTPQWIHISTYIFIQAGNFLSYVTLNIVCLCHFPYPGTQLEQIYTCMSILTKCSFSPSRSFFVILPFQCGRCGLLYYCIQIEIRRLLLLVWLLRRVYSERFLNILNNRRQKFFLLIAFRLLLFIYYYYYLYL